MTLEEITSAIRKIRDECNAFLAEIEVDQITHEQASQIQSDLDKVKASIQKDVDKILATQCACGRDLLTETELKVQTCHICLTNDGTLLGSHAGER